MAAGQEQGTPRLEDVVRRGLGVFGQSVSTIADGLRSMDGALREMDGALTGGHARPSSAPGPNPASEEQVAQRVTSLVQQGREEASRAGDAQAPGVAARFQEALRMLFQLPLPGRPGGLADLMPSPMDALRTGLRDLRGSMAMVRLANGTGSLADVEEVAAFADELGGRAQRAVATVQSPPASDAPAATASGTGKSTRTRKRPTERGSGRTPRKAASSSSGKRPRRSSKATKLHAADAAFAAAVADELGDAQVKAWARNFADGKLSEAEWVAKLTDHAAQTRDTLDDVYERAAARLGASGA